MLVVDDDPIVSDVAARYLAAAGFVVQQARDGFEALDSVSRFAPDLVVLDRMLPGIDGVEVCRRVRRLGNIPIVMLTALGSEESRIAGFEAGADDYVVKPFSPRELVLRVTSILRRSAADEATPPTIERGVFRLDSVARVISREGTPLALTVREFDLLSHFLRHPNTVYSREDLLRQVWGWTYGDRSTVTVHVRRLREKIEDDATTPRLLATVWGIGYRFDDRSAELSSAAAAS